MNRLFAALACLALSLPAAAAAPAPATGTTSLVGSWEVVGAGGPTGFSKPDRWMMVFRADGTTETLIWEDGAVVPETMVARYTLDGDVLTIDAPELKVHTVDRIRWEGRYLLLQEEGADGKTPPLYLERRAWM